MHLRHLFLAAGAIAAVSAIPLAASALEAGQQSRRAEPKDPNIREKFSEAEKDDDGKYKQSQAAADACFNWHMYSLVHINQWGAGYDGAMEGCQRRHGFRPRESLETQKMLREATERYVRDMEKGPEWDALSPEVRREEAQPTDDFTQRTWGKKVARDAEGRMVNGPKPNPTNNNNNNAFSLLGASGREMKKYFYPGARNQGSNNAHPAFPGAASSRKPGRPMFSMPRGH